MLKTQGMLHFSLAVTDLDRSRKFYEGVLNLKVVEQSPRMVFLQTGDDYLILAKGDEPLKYDTNKSTPVHHAFKV
jgi:catechol 2,3-dioxygenase-like lactoylglutathione lyase family enzyme